MIRRPPRSTPKPSSAASDVYKRQVVPPPKRTQAFQPVGLRLGSFRVGRSPRKVWPAHRNSQSFLALFRSLLEGLVRPGQTFRRGPESGPRNSTTAIALHCHRRISRDHRADDVPCLGLSAFARINRENFKAFVCTGESHSRRGASTPVARLQTIRIGGGSTWPMKPFRRWFH